MHKREEEILKTYHTVLTIAGSDCIGGAGVQADIKTCTALGVYAMAAITAVTAQNTNGVIGYDAVSNDMLQAQLNAIVEDVTPDAIKIGMLPNADSVKIVADFIQKNKLKNIVLDTICVSTSGHSLTSESVPAVMSEYLFPLADVITPNIPEAETFAGKKVDDRDIESFGHELMQKYELNALLLKGGHLLGNECVDRLYVGDAVHTFSHAKIDTVNTHGTGCSLSSAIAANLAKGAALHESVQRATSWIAQAIEQGAQYKFGHGHGPINHLFNII
jgi:hydroxymethylpyrimidine/phosphomethylpyrimidine kinase